MRYNRAMAKKKKHSLPVVGFIVYFSVVVGIFIVLAQVSQGGGSPRFLITLHPRPTPIPTPIPRIVTPVRVPILMYHYVEIVQDKRDTIRRGLDILPTTIDAEIATLLTHKYTPIFMSDLADYLDGKSSLPEKPIVLTFDDGYRDFYTDAYPILKKYHVKATAYVVPGFLNRPNYMTKDQVKEVAASDLIEIAAHTVHHVNLRGTQPALLTTEINESKNLLEQLIDKPVTDFAYPYGLYNQIVISAVAAAGYRTAVTTKPGDLQTKDTRFELLRLRPGGRVGIAFISWLESIKN